MQARATPDMFSADSFKPTIAVSGALRALRRGHGSTGAPAGPSGSAEAQRPGIEHADGRDPARAAAVAESDNGMRAAGLRDPGDPSPHATGVEGRTKAACIGRPYQLRRDGMRPLRFMGLPLLRLQRRWHLDPSVFGAASCDAEPAGLRLRLEFYLESAGLDVIASAVLEPAEHERIRPVFSVRRLGRSQDLGALLRSHLRVCGSILPRGAMTSLA